MYLQELLTALVSRAVVGVSANTRRDNPFVANVIPHGVDEIFQPLPIGRPDPSIVFVGAVEGRKRGRFLLEILDLVRPAFPEATLTFVGSQGRCRKG